MTDQSVSENATQQVYCNDCRRKTLHLLLKTRVDEGSEPWDEHYAVSWRTTYQMFECCGCKAVVLVRCHEFSEWDGPEIRYFPPRISRHKPEWFEDLPAELQLLLREVYLCLDANTTALPLMGIRAVIDMVIVDKIGDAGNFTIKMETLETRGFLSHKNRELLEVALEAGHAASHRGWLPGIKRVNAVMDIVENLLQAMYVLDKVAEAVRTSTPPRPAALKKAKGTTQ